MLKPRHGSTQDEGTDSVASILGPPGVLAELQDALDASWAMLLLVLCRTAWEGGRRMGMAR